ncbi:hypothetical protein J2797_006700 [Paraburkholderia terricola]|uniref:hypothetical protein n=1 Tax=Paraburkholderia terricola TaxID=169427 RepID=UPI002864908F|nr:hypothetical protein [Paraburkholderia terricola]MDR6496773.1 hypothetical protein [Paraburkholderia terricola]
MSGADLEEASLAAVGLVIKAIFTATFSYQVVRLVEDQRATDAQKLTKAHIRIVKLEERVDVRRHFETKWEHIVRGATHARREKGTLAYRYIESLIDDSEEECREEDDPTLLYIARNMTLYQGIWGSPAGLQEIDHYSAQECAKRTKPPRRQRRQVPLKIEAGSAASA